MGRSLRTDRLGMSESIGVGVLLGMTVLVTAIVGVNVLVVDEDAGGGPQANFTYEYIDSNELLLVTHSRGDSLQAGNIEFEGPNKKVTWAELANRNESELVTPGDLAQLGPGNAYGERVSQQDTITVYHNTSGNRTRLSQWPQS